VESPQVIARPSVGRRSLADANDNQTATLLPRDCQLLNVYSGEIYRTDIAIDGDRVVSINREDSIGADKIIERAGRFAARG
jgi:adenine deaminase